MISVFFTLRSQDFPVNGVVSSLSHSVNVLLTLDGRLAYQENRSKICLIALLRTVPEGSEKEVQKVAVHCSLTEVVN